VLEGCEEAPKANSQFLAKQARLDVRSFGELVLDHCIVVVVTVFLFSERHLPHLKARLCLLAKAKQVLT